MNKSKKGFTLIEMLVVIAIIAILVSIIIPTVQSATTKAAAATNAANLRSVKAEATTNRLLTGDVKPHSEPLSKKVGTLVAAGLKPTVTPLEDGSVQVTYGGVTIDQLAAIAGGGSVDEDGNVTDSNGTVVPGVPGGDEIEKPGEDVEDESKTHTADQCEYKPIGNDTHACKTEGTCPGGVELTCNYGTGTTCTVCGGEKAHEHSKKMVQKDGNMHGCSGCTELDVPCDTSKGNCVCGRLHQHSYVNQGDNHKCACNDTQNHSWDTKTEQQHSCSCGASYNHNGTSNDKKCNTCGYVVKHYYNSYDIFTGKCSTCGLSKDAGNHK